MTEFSSFVYIISLKNHISHWGKVAAALER